jgi:hypothetical protein
VTAKHLYLSTKLKEVTLQKAIIEKYLFLPISDSDLPSIVAKAAWSSEGELHKLVQTPWLLIAFPILACIRDTLLNI